MAPAHTQSGHLGLGLGTQEQGLKSIFQQHRGGHKGALGQGPGQVPSANQGRGSTGATRVQQCQQQQDPTGLAMGDSALVGPLPSGVARRPASPDTVRAAQ